jgi:ABC-type Fe3+/spermidine/putrescine transport system ATPase subunit
MPVPAHLALRGLAKSYGGVAAVAGVDLEVVEGEFVALLGPSGCGKTTLLRCIAGLVQPNAGEIVLGGRRLDTVPIWRRDLGMVFQSYALFPHMTVAENVAFGLRMRRVARDEARARVAAALDLVRMGGFESRLPSQLSGGQQQRVALARALVTNPTALLLDEPLGALDAKLRESMQVELRQLQRRLRLTTVFVTHDQQEALGMADRVAVMRAGRIEQVGSATAVYEAPRTAFVAEFIGQMNRIPGRITAEGALETAAGRLRGRPPASPIAQGAAALAMVRPERIELGGEGEGNKVAGRLAEILFTGEKVSYFVETRLGRMIATEPNGPRRGAREWEAGQDVTLSGSSEDMHLFPGEAS